MFPGDESGTWVREMKKFWMGNLLENQSETELMRLLSKRLFLIGVDPDRKIVHGQLVTNEIVSFNYRRKRRCVLIRKTTI